MPIEEAREWARTNLAAISDEDISLLKTAQKSLEVGVAVLQRIAQGGVRAKEASADLEAARELVRAAIAIRKTVGPTTPGRGGAGVRGISLKAQLDLFDVAESNWDLDDPNKI